VLFLISQQKSWCFSICSSYSCILILCHESLSYFQSIYNTTCCFLPQHRIMKLVRPQTVHKIATTAFRSHLSSSNPQPLVLTGLIDHWPALSNWKVSNKLGRLRDKQWEDRIIEVEWGKKRGSYMDEGYRRVHMPLGESVMLPHALSCPNYQFRCFSRPFRSISRRFHSEDYPI
jgi:hypothetical protein